MAELSAQLVKELRDKTGAGMMDCKKALAEVGGDLEAAIDHLRKKGAATAAKKAGREAREGLIAQAILPGAKVGVVVEVNCETDFVAKNDGFRQFCDDVARKIAAEPGVDLEPDRVAAVAKIGENVVIRRHQRFEVSGSGLVAAYIHTGGKVGVLVEVGAGSDASTTREEFKQLVRDITLQIAAANPVSVDRTALDPALLERERAVYRDQVQGKPANILEKIVEGKMEKFYGTSCLVDQAFIKNPDQTVSNLVEATGKTLGDKLEIRRFVRFNVGEEIAG
jgi:elongation factor Ts